jgi:MYXO-CTERM domain-containing protein
VTSETAARQHLVRHAEALGTPVASLRDAAMTGTHDVAGGGTIVQFEQRVHGISVFRTRASVLLDADKNLVSIANGLTPASNGVGKAPSFKQPGEAAIANAYGARTGLKIGAGAVRDRGAIAGSDSRNYAVETPAGALRILVATAKQVYYPLENRLIPAYYVELLGRAARSNENQAWGIVVAANDDRVLYQTSLTDYDIYNYRVWAAATGNKIPMDGPIVDSTPYPSGMPDGVVIANNTTPPLVPMEGFNKNPSMAADPWLPTGATVTFGNNVQAYSDRNQYTDEAGVTRNDGYDEGGTALDSGFDFRADITSTTPLSFDRTYNLTLAPNASVNQIKAAITQLFYVNNWMHDYWYDSGFNEAAGVAQLSNYGRPGGVEGDPIQAQAQDSAESGQGNNANMNTLADGTPPVMQMYVWNGLPNRTLTSTPMPSLTFPDGLGASSFGPQTFAPPARPAVIFNDGTGTTSDACEAVPANTYNNRIVVIDRGTCAFTVKATNAQASGATGMILVNNAAGNTPVSPGGSDPTITIPLLGVSLENGAPLKTAIGAGTVNLTMVRGVETQRDGTIDNTVVAHEWGHYLHHRLVLCGSTSCGGMSEGWADFNAILMVIKDGDTFGANVYPMAQYASAGLSKNAGYFGIRRAPYSAAHTKNPFTFKHIRQSEPLPTGVPLAPAGAQMNEVHNVGEIWAQTLFQGYINLLAAGTTAARPFEDTKRRMADYIVAGMKATPTEPTFVEQRDAILRPIYLAGKTDASRKADFDALAAGFADRGLGAGAIAPPAISSTLDEAVESFSIKGTLELDSFILDDSVKSCDNDKILDAGEQGNLTISVHNGGWETLTGSTITVTTTDPNLTFANGGTATLGAVEPYGSAASVTIGVTAAAATPARTLAALKITIANPNAATASTDTTVTALVNYDDKAGVSSSDDVESNSTPPAWTPKAGPGTTPIKDRAWSRMGDAKNHFLHANDTGSLSDEVLESPSLNVSTTVPFVMNFTHRYSFEFGQPDTDIVYFDGGVIEISEDNGATWKDAYHYGTTMVDPGYSQIIYRSTPPPAPDAAVPDASTSTENPLADQPAFAGDSPGYPNSWLTTSLDFGSIFAGKTIKVRFRVGTDPGGGAPGWDIDNISFGGSQFSSLTNTPFGGITANAGMCSDGGTTMDAGRPDSGGMMVDAARDTGTATDANRGDSTTSDAPTGDGTTTDGAASDAPSDAPRDTTPPPTTTTTGGGGTTDDSCNCSVPGGRSSGNTATMLGVLGAISMVLRRRRRVTH